MTFFKSLFFAQLALFPVSGMGQDYFNLAAGKPVKASWAQGDAARITDSSLATGNWRIKNSGQRQWVEIDLTAEFAVYGAHIYFDPTNAMPLEAFRLEMLDENGGWRPISGGEVADNFTTRLELRFPAPAVTSAVRLVTTNRDPFGIAEIQLWGRDIPPIPYGVALTKEPPFSTDTHWVCVNQIAYNSGAPKRFTVPTAVGNLPFEVVDKASGKTLFRGRLHDGTGDFTAFEPQDVPGREYFIRVKGGGLKVGVSHPFEIGRHAIQRMSYEPAVWFMNDCRSVVGSHNSGYGGCAWRDGAYYTYEVPSMVMMYLSDPVYFNRMPAELDWQAERTKVLTPEFKITQERADRDALTTAQNYYLLLPPPLRNGVPDLVQDIRFGTGWIMLDPITVDISSGGDPAGERMHAQTVEQLAWFLYAWPMLKTYVGEDFYRLALQDALLWWERAGLFNVIEEIGTGKGRNAPAHSVMPNLMMYEVALRECPASARRFLDAAVAQAEWAVKNLDWENPLHTKGQRMSEHKTVTGLVHLLLNYPEYAPDGLREKLHALARRYASMSENMWDFRRFDLDEHWTIPGFNDAGNVIGFPACAFAVAMTLEPGSLRDRIVQLAYAAYDNIYGRNPLNAHAANHPELGFRGVEKGWPYHYQNNVTARLEITRGTLASLPGSEMYPFNPKGRPRHPEGWVAYNAAWNTSLAFLNFYEGKSDISTLRNLWQQ